MHRIRQSIHTPPSALAMLLFAMLVVALVPARVHAWGSRGHSLTGAIASRYLSPSTRNAIKSILPPTWNGSLRKAAIWADAIKSRSTHPWSYSLHYMDGTFTLPIDVNGTTPSVCELDLRRDCAERGCVVTALANYTERLQEAIGDGVGVTCGTSKTSFARRRPQKQIRLGTSPVDGAEDELLGANDEQELHSTSLSDADLDIVMTPIQESLLFLIHFVGDIHQPLHLCGKLRGGNDYHVLFDGKTRTIGWDGNERDINLHQVWDDLILNEYVTKEFGGNSMLFLNSLFFKLDSGEFFKKRREWANCTSPGVPTESSDDHDPFDSTGLSCALRWGKEAGRLNCENVWNGVDGVGVDLGRGKYFMDGARIVEQQLARAGIRMAALLNAIFSKSACPPTSDTLIVQL